LHDSLLARLAPVKEIAQIGAALGREFPYALLAAADRPGQRQLFGQAILKGPEGALASASGLGRVRRDVADPELLQGPADL
jgi:hypothetical protein